ncbi:MAG: NADH-quinone oxidoreductase subunit M, partial [Opitutaceae bacterium]|nr:NADH-quinone oxidoreductase subunit M [Opitutaceae bacterium]
AADGFSLGALTEAAARLAPSEAVIVFALIFFGFATLAGLFPLHTWAPTGHVAAPTGVSMLLAGVVMKLGAYGCLRVAMPLFPDAFAAWHATLGWLAVAGIVYAGLIALVQDDFKFVIGYSSVSHMGFVMLGLATGEREALAGAVLQMFSHGVIAGLLFAVVGRMVYERTHTRDLTVLQTWPLHRLLPGVAGVFVVAGLASMGLPGFSGFPSELKILIGAWRTHAPWALTAGFGVLVAGAFTIKVMQRAFFGRVTAGSTLGAAHEPFAPISLPEKAGATLLIVATVIVGLKPDLLLDWIVPALQSPAFALTVTKGMP